MSKVFNKIPHELEQECVHTFFSNVNSGILVDVGANDPFIESQSYHLEKLGWHGLLIEPLPNMCELLRQNRTGVVVPYACSSKENHKKILPLISFGVCSTLESKLIHTNKVKQDVIYIETRTLDSILEENNINFTKATLYRTVASDLSDLEDVSYDMLVFFSPGGIESLFKNFPDFKQNNTAIAAFGPTTANAVIKNNLRLDVHAPMPNAPSMTAAIELFAVVYAPLAVA